ncbi:hypothetical protein BIY28_14110 [Brenneria goodwinii]|nr:hypothetical protein BIY28_14110 [Brenneria goodwinii]
MTGRYSGVDEKIFGNDGNNSPLRHSRVGGNQSMAIHGFSGRSPPTAAGMTGRYSGVDEKIFARITAKVFAEIAVGISAIMGIRLFLIIQCARPSALL